MAQTLQFNDVSGSQQFFQLFCRGRADASHARSQGTDKNAWFLGQFRPEVAQHEKRFSICLFQVVQENNQRACASCIPQMIGSFTKKLGTVHGLSAGTKREFQVSIISDRKNYRSQLADNLFPNSVSPAPHRPER
ncbi:hypothetical protein JOF48_002663 [Arthrobacter stackebrandtii]|uniref:Uncharacterized protein n=1 Tax=Arthrobacter stackebrandtii TaxID=272161 RepID=A0ABS4YYR4_9MICC|nr:hypothetical protein [Arthrobacter stackebrandtii]MBP2413864.1 hypothetical protein [Arthrobacter stackebrandtii]